MAIEMTGGKIVNERGTVVTFRQKCEACGYVFDWNKTTIVPMALEKYDLSPAPSAGTIKRSRSAISTRVRISRTPDPPHHT